MRLNDCAKKIVKKNKNCPYYRQGVDKDVFELREESVMRAWIEKMRHPIRAVRAYREQRKACRERYSPERAMFAIKKPLKSRNYGDDFMVFWKGGSVLFILACLLRLYVARTDIGWLWSFWW